VNGELLIFFFWQFSTTRHTRQILCKMCDIRTAVSVVRLSIAAADEWVNDNDFENCQKIISNQFNALRLASPLSCARAHPRPRDRPPSSFRVHNIYNIIYKCNLLHSAINPIFYSCIYLVGFFPRDGDYSGGGGPLCRSWRSI